MWLRNMCRASDRGHSVRQWSSHIRSRWHMTCDLSLIIAGWKKMLEGWRWDMNKPRVAWLACSWASLQFLVFFILLIKFMWQSLFPVLSTQTWSNALYRATREMRREQHRCFACTAAIDVAIDVAGDTTSRVKETRDWEVVGSNQSETFKVSNEVCLANELGKCEYPVQQVQRLEF